MKVLNINGVEIGKGMPKICVPIVAGDEAELKLQAEEADKSQADIIELRIDYFDRAEDAQYVNSMVSVLKENSDKPVILTYRTGFEGGERNIEREDYANLLIDILEDSEFEIIDVELFTGDDLVKRIVEKAHEKGVKVIMSNHDFKKTPECQDIVGRLEKMQQLGCDIAKIAVMPNSRSDVVKLMQATVDASKELNVPVVTMSMSGDGLISRLAGEQTGSTITFGSVKKASAPGQINVDELKNVLEIIHENI